MRNLDALDHDAICNDISSLRNGSWSCELKAKNKFLTDIQENTVHKSPISNDYVDDVQEINDKIYRIFFACRKFKGFCFMLCKD